MWMDEKIPHRTAAAIVVGLVSAVLVFAGSKKAERQANATVGSGDFGSGFGSSVASGDESTFGGGCSIGGVAKEGGEADIKSVSGDLLAVAAGVFFATFLVACRAARKVRQAGAACVFACPAKG